MSTQNITTPTIVEKTEPVEPPKEEKLKPLERAKVYFTKEITPSSLIKIFKAVGFDLRGNVGVKISTGEPGGKNYLKPELIKDIVQYLQANIIECCTAYGGKRQNLEDHLKCVEDHGFTKIADVDILDSEGEFAIPTIQGCKHLDKDIVGSHLEKYDSLLMQSYVWSHLPAQDDFLESMAEACSAVMDYYDKRGGIVYINVINNLSVDCDCDSNPETPCMQDIGIVASLDPVACDRASLDLIYKSQDPGREHFLERVETRHGAHTIEHAVTLGLGTTFYEFIDLDK